MRKPVTLGSVKAGACLLLLNVELVSASEEEHERAYEDSFHHWTAVHKRLAELWSESAYIVCADSYFASVQSVLALLNIALRFIGVEKMANIGFPTKYLSELELEGHGSHYSIVSDIENSTKQLMALVSVYRNRCYFMSTTSSTNPGSAHECVRWRQTPTGLRRVRITIEQPNDLEKYHSSCTSIDQHNRSARTIYGLNAILR